MSTRLKTDLATARVPRYTSYPTAPHFNASVTAKTAMKWLEAIPADEPLSLYAHIPFCDSLCWFCGCHMRVVNTYTPVAAYSDVLLREIGMVAAALRTRRPVTHIHFGGGSPTILKPHDIARIAETLHTLFDIRPGAEFAVEIDPRGLADETIEAFAKAGVTRASLGVQDVNPRVQAAVNRIQPLEVTQSAVDRLRAAGITALNIDLMYGLPHQTIDDVKRTVEAAVAMVPQRFAVFGYAHVPEMKRHQALIDAAALPGGEERVAQVETVHALLTASGYVAIGLDHFARADDPLAVALAQGRLKRNFQGYTTDDAATLIGFGASAISSLPQGYAQNVVDMPEYRRLILNGELATARGRALTEDDRLRRAIIERLMCDLAVDVEAIAAAHGAGATDFSAAFEALQPLIAEGICKIDGTKVTVPREARAGVRLVCAAFDAYLHPQAPARHAVAV
jgi:oxygen-independent coproporphyrinogen-3 oxidase